AIDPGDGRPVRRDRDWPDAVAPREDACLTAGRGHSQNRHLRPTGHALDESEATTVGRPLGKEVQLRLAAAARGRCREQGRSKQDGAPHRPARYRAMRVSPGQARRIGAPLRTLAIGWRTQSWPPHSRLFVAGDGQRWAIADDARALEQIAGSLGVAV